MGAHGRWVPQGAPRIAGLFLLAIPFAAYASFNGGKPEAFVYFPLPFLFTLTITGTWLLVRPWIQKRRAQKAA